MKVFWTSDNYFPSVTESSAEMHSWSSAEMHSWSSAEMHSWSSAEMHSWSSAEMHSWSSAEMHSWSSAEMHSWSSAEMHSWSSAEMHSWSSAEMHSWSSAEMHSHCKECTVCATCCIQAILQSKVQSNQPTLLCCLTHFLPINRTILLFYCHAILFKRIMLFF